MRAAESGGAAGLKPLRLALAEIGRGQVQPVYLIHGEEAWLVHHARRKLVAALEGAGASVQRFAGDTDVERVLGELVSLSLFAERRVVLWQDCPCLPRGGADGPRKRLLEVLDAGLDPQSSILVLTAEKADRASKLYRRVAALGVELQYAALSPYNLGAPGRDEAFPYVEAYLAEQRKSLRPDAFRELRQRVPTDLWSVVSELDRLVAYVGDAPAIELRDVEQLVSHSKTDVVFELVDAVGSRQLDSAFELLERLVASGTNPLAILATVVQSLVQVREARALVDSGVGWSSGLNYSAFQQRVLPAVRRNAPDSAVLSAHPFAAFKAFQRAQSFQPEELDRLLQGLADIDLRLKSSGEDGLRALQMFLIARLTRRRAAQRAGS